MSDLSTIKRKGAQGEALKPSILKWASGNIGGTDNAEAAPVEDVGVNQMCCSTFDDCGTQIRVWPFR